MVVLCTFIFFDWLDNSLSVRALWLKVIIGWVVAPVVSLEGVIQSNVTGVFFSMFVEITSDIKKNEGTRSTVFLYIVKKNTKFAIYK